jgi:Fe-S cluster biogenesis protein NfuA
MLTIEDVIASQVRPLLQSHNGDIQFIDVSAEGTVRVKLTGACSACPGARQTLTEVVATALKAVCPEVKSVVAVHEVSDELIDEALQLLRRAGRHAG